MLDTYRELIVNQYEAAFCTLNACIDRCPDDAWNMPIANHKFGQVAFHALFFADYYLGPNAGAQRDQRFHRDHTHIFDDYEELQDRAPIQLHDRSFTRKYLDHCRSKVRDVVAAETAESLSARADFEGKDFSRAELHVYNIRHIQHHAAQLILRLRIDCNQDTPWFRSGWQDA